LPCLAKTAAALDRIYAGERIGLAHSESAYALLTNPAAALRIARTHGPVVQTHGHAADVVETFAVATLPVGYAHFAFAKAHPELADAVIARTATTVGCERAKLAAAVARSDETHAIFAGGSRTALRIGHARLAFGQARWSTALASATGVCIQSGQVVAAAARDQDDAQDEP